jgi:hypothetical protein
MTSKLSRGFFFSTKAISCYLLFVYAPIAFSLRNYQTFVDEGAALDLGSCVLKGLALYRDLFHHHLPLPVYLAALVTGIGGVSLPLIRLVMFGLETAVFAVLIFTSRAPFPVAFSALIWALISPYYDGNMLLYDNLAMFGGMVLGVLVFSVLARGMDPSKRMFIMLAAAGVAVCLCNPFCIPLTFLATGALFLARQVPRSFVVKLWLAIAGSLGAYVLYLAATGALKPFYADLVVFNLTVYQRYTALLYSPVDIAGNFRHQLLLLDIFNPDWYRSLDPLHFNPSTLGPSFDTWLFSGFFYRAVSLAACLLYALRKDYRTALFLYVFLMLLPLRVDQGFHAGPFVVFSLFLCGVVIEECLSFPRAGKYLTLAACCVPCLFLGLNGARYLQLHAFQFDFAGKILEASLIKEAAAGHPNAAFGRLPSGDYEYYLSGLRPVSKFVYFYPWIADFTRAQMDSDLAREAANDDILLLIDVDHQSWNVPNSFTLRSELHFARQHLVKEQVGWLTAWASPGMVKGTIAARPGLPARSDVGVYRDGVWSLHSIVTGETLVRNFGQKLGGLPVTGDWDGTGTTKLGVYLPRDGRWLLDLNGNGAVDPGEEVSRFGGVPGDIPVTGDWNGTGNTKIGIFRPSTGEWLLDMDGDGVFNPAKDRRLVFGGKKGDVPLTGDWTGSGVTKVGTFSDGFWWTLDLDGNGVYESGTDIAFAYGGKPGDVPVAGDWNGDGRSKPGIFRQGHLWMLDMNGDFRVGPVGNITVVRLPPPVPDQNFTFGGSPGDVPVTGAW